MTQLYDLGYLEFKDPKLLEEFLKATDAHLWDIRFSPRSRDTKWSGTSLSDLLGQRYHHVKHLGNANYKGSFNEIEIVDLDRGIRELHEALRTVSVVLMCACWDRRSCHRSVVASKIEHTFCSIPLTRKIALEIIESKRPKPPKQLDIFSDYECTGEG